jgi:hypothetical protein
MYSLGMLLLDVLAGRAARGRDAAAELPFR